LSGRSTALYARHLASAWRNTYVINAVIALYLNLFTLVAQLFDKIAAQKTSAQTQTEPPFAIAHAVVL
jgi:hypothetical protein